LGIKITKRSFHTEYQRVIYNFIDQELSRLTTTWIESDRDSIDLFADSPDYAVAEISWIKGKIEINISTDCQMSGGWDLADKFDLPRSSDSQVLRSIEKKFGDKANRMLKEWGQKRCDTEFGNILKKWAGIITKLKRRPDILDIVLTDQEGKFEKIVYKARNDKRDYFNKQFEKNKKKYQSK
jgi:hypothetical protein